MKLIASIKFVHRLDKTRYFQIVQEVNEIFPNEDAHGWYRAYVKGDDANGLLIRKKNNFHNIFDLVGIYMIPRRNTKKKM